MSGNVPPPLGALFARPDAISHAIVREEHGEDVRDRDCVTYWLTGQQLSGDEASCFCWETDPFPSEDFPDKLMSERPGTFTDHYRYIAKAGPWVREWQDQARQAAQVRPQSAENTSWQIGKRVPGDFIVPTDYRSESVVGGGGGRPCITFRTLLPSLNLPVL